MGHHTVYHMYIIGVPKGERKEKKKSEEIMTENFPNLLNNTNLHTRKAQQTLKKEKFKEIPSYTIIKVLKVKKTSWEHLESRKRKTSHLQGLRLTADFSAETAEARKQSNKLLKIKQTNKKTPKQNKKTCHQNPISIKGIFQKLRWNKDIPK